MNFEKTDLDGTSTTEVMSYVVLENGAYNYKFDHMQDYEQAINFILTYQPASAYVSSTYHPTLTFLITWKDSCGEDRIPDSDTSDLICKASEVATNTDDLSSVSISSNPQNALSVLKTFTLEGQHCVQPTSASVVAENENSQSYFTVELYGDEILVNLPS